MTTTAWPAATRTIDEWDYVDELDEIEREPPVGRWRDIEVEPGPEDGEAGDSWVLLDETGLVGADKVRWYTTIDAEAAAEELLDAWYGRFAHGSSVRRAARAPEYRIIILLGERAIPAVLERLEASADPLWVWLLGDLAGFDAAEGAATIADAARAWVQWGRARSGAPGA